MSTWPAHGVAPQYAAATCWAAAMSAPPTANCWSGATAAPAEAAQGTASPSRQARRANGSDATRGIPVLRRPVGAPIGLQTALSGRVSYSGLPGLEQASRERLT